MSLHILFLDMLSAKRARALEVAKNKGLKITLASLNPSDELSKLADHIINVDLYDLKNLMTELKNAHRINPFDGVITFWDRHVETAALVSEALGLPGNDPYTAKCTRNKFLTRQAMQKANVPHPRFQMIKSYLDLEEAALYVGYPFIFKPVGGASSKGIFKINRDDDLRLSFSKMVEATSPQKDKMFTYYQGEYIAEEFMTGKEFSVEGVAKDSELHFAGITEKWTTDGDFTETQHLFPARLTNAKKEEVYDVVRSALRAISYKVGAFHVEVMLTPGGAKIVEINGRLGGDFITTHLVPLGRGIDIIGQSINAAVGLPLDMNSTFEKNACVKFLLAEKEGVVSNWEGIDQAKKIVGVSEVIIDRPVNSLVRLPPKIYGEFRLAAVITQGDSPDDALSTAQVACDLLKVSIDQVPKKDIVLFLGSVRKGEYETIAKRGFNIGVIQDDLRSPTLPLGFDFAPVIKFDFASSNEKLLEVVDQIKSEWNILAVLNTRESYVGCHVMISKYLGLPHISEASLKLVTNKNLMRKAFVNEIGPDSTARCIQVENEVDLIRFAKEVNAPIVLKPVNLAASLFVKKVERLEEIIPTYRNLALEIDSYLKKMNINSQVLIQAEEFLSGSVHSIDFIVGENNLATPIVDVVTGMDLGRDDFHHFKRSAPSQLPLDKQKDAIELASRGVRALGLKNCVAHVEFIQTNFGARLLEIAARPGAHRNHLLEEVFDFSINEYLLTILMGRESEYLSTAFEVKKHYAIVTPFPKKPLIFQGVEKLADLIHLPTYRRHEIKATLGQAIGPASAGFYSCFTIEFASQNLQELSCDIAKVSLISQIFK